MIKLAEHPIRDDVDIRPISYDIYTVYVPLRLLQIYASKHNKTRGIITNQDSDIDTALSTRERQINVTIETIAELFTIEPSIRTTNAKALYTIILNIEKFIQAVFVDNRVNPYIHVDKGIVKLAHRLVDMHNTVITSRYSYLENYSKNELLKVINNEYKKRNKPPVTLKDLAGYRLNKDGWFSIIEFEYILELFMTDRPPLQGPPVVTKVYNKNFKNEII